MSSALQSDRGRLGLCTFFQMRFNMSSDCRRQQIWRDLSSRKYPRKGSKKSREIKSFSVQLRCWRHDFKWALQRTLNNATHTTDLWAYSPPWYKRLATVFRNNRLSVITRNLTSCACPFLPIEQYTCILWPPYCEDNIPCDNCGTSQVFEMLFKAGKQHYGRCPFP